MLIRESNNGDKIPYGAFCKIPLIRPADPGITVQRVFVVSKLGAQYQICRQHNLPCCEFCKRLYVLGFCGFCVDLLDGFKRSATRLRACGPGDGPAAADSLCRSAENSQSHPKRTRVPDSAALGHQKAAQSDPRRVHGSRADAVSRTLLSKSVISDHCDR